MVQITAFGGAAHGQHRSLSLPHGDILIHAGDFTSFGKQGDAADFNDWLGTLDGFQYKLVVLGNHEVNAPWASDAVTILNNAMLLVDNGATLQLASGAFCSVWGTGFYWPVETPHFTPPYAAVPAGTDVLISHGPAASHVDNGMGCAFLLEHVQRLQPRVLVCGHIHEAHGLCQGSEDTRLKGVTFVNAANAGGPSRKQSHSRQMGWAPVVLDI